MMIGKLHVYPGFCVWQYLIPSKQPRGFWHGDNPADKPQWAYAKLNSSGICELSAAVSGFATEDEAVKAALARRFGSVTEALRDENWNDADRAWMRAQSHSN